MEPHDPTIIYYGPYACPECYPELKDQVAPAVLIAKASHEQGGAEFDYPDGPIYPNTPWVPHVHRTLESHPIALPIADQQRSGLRWPTTPASIGGTP